MGRFIKKADRIILDKKLIGSLLERVGTQEKIILGGVTVSRDKVIAIIKEQIALSTASSAARIAWIIAAQRENDFARKHKQLRARLADWIRVVFGVDEMRAFGLEPPKKRRKLTSAEKKRMVEKMVATRAARRPKKG